MPSNPTLRQIDEGRTNAKATVTPKKSTKTKDTTAPVVKGTGTRPVNGGKTPEGGQSFVPTGQGIVAVNPGTSTARATQTTSSGMKGSTSSTVVAGRRTDTQEVVGAVHAVARNDISANNLLYADTKRELGEKKKADMHKPPLMPGSPYPPETPEAYDPFIIFFGGSIGDDILVQGPEPALQAPAWARIADAPPIRYPGVPVPLDELWKCNYTDTLCGKRGQASQAWPYENSNTLAIGFSAGGDAALIYAYDYVINNPGGHNISGVAVLGGTMSGTMIDGETQLADQWSTVLDTLLLNGIDVYIIDDSAGGGNTAESYMEPQGATGEFLFVPRTGQEHWQGGTSGELGTGTNNSSAFVDEVLTWFEDHYP